MSDVKKVFISGTKLDLESHHQAAIDVCNSLGFLPIDMSFFGAMDENAVEGSKKQLEDCDLYVGIIGFRYGYIAEDHDKSVTEIEFDYARECGIERLCFLAHESHRFSQKVLDLENAERIRQLREKVSAAHIVEFFRNSADFRQKLTETLAKWRSSTRVTDEVLLRKTPSTTHFRLF